MVNFATVKTLALAVSLSAPLAVVADPVLVSGDNYIQVNYYWDGGCTDYALDIPNPPESMFDYAYTNTNSANIANCNYGYCSCTFYTGPNGEGSSQTVTYPSPNCASNWGGGFQSFSCVYN
jgi:hypothetical protein